MILKRGWRSSSGGDLRLVRRAVPVSRKIGNQMRKRNRGSVPNKRVLIVSYRFPPDSTAGSVRVSQFVRWLPSYGWEPYVLTCIPSEYAPQGLESPVSEDHIIRTLSRNYMGNLKQEIYRMIKGEARISSERTASVSTSMSNISRICDPFSEVRWPDYGLFWEKGAVQKGLTFLRDNPVDLIFSSSPPPSSHIVSSRIERRTGIPWVAEYRDPWSSHAMKRTSLMEKLERKYEKSVMSNAAAILTVSDTLSGDLKSLFPARRNIHVIPNGYDPGAYYRYTDADAHKLTVTYTGIIYSAYRIEPFFISLRKLVDEGFITRDCLEINFYGKDSHAVTDAARKYFLSDAVMFRGRVPHAAVANIQMKSNLLLLFGWCGEGGKSIVTGKVFEYLAAGRPIICFGPGGDEIERLLYETRGGVYCTSEKATYDTLKKWIGEWKETGTIDHQPRWDRIMTYSRERQTETLAGIFDKVMEEAAEAVTRGKEQGSTRAI